MNYGVCPKCGMLFTPETHGGYTLYLCGRCGEAFTPGPGDLLNYESGSKARDTRRAAARLYMRPYGPKEAR